MFSARDKVGGGLEASDRQLDGASGNIVFVFWMMLQANR